MPSLGGGGAEKVMLTLARAFAEGGDKVDLLVARCEGAHRDKIPDGVRLIDLEAGRVLRSLRPLAAYLRKNRPDALISTLNYANVVAVLARDLAGVSTPVLVREDSTPTHSLEKNWKGRLQLGLMALTYARAQTIVAVSQGVAEALVEARVAPARRITTIYNPVELDQIEAASTQLPTHPWLAGERGGRPRPLVLAVGRLTPAKDYPNLLDAMARLKQTHSARLLILGEGELRAELEARIADLGLEQDVAMPGFVSNPYACMARADVCVLSSRWEGFGNVLVEALAVGAPVVATDCPGGPGEILEGGRWGRLVPVGDALALARALGEALDEDDAPDPRPRVGAFDHTAIAEAYRRVLFGGESDGEYPRASGDAKRWLGLRK
ncbi:glycosyl transferase [Lujinxingia litoralis]|uniref:Glycosyl transferase n=1 Tax=Lujinxingia litoralis TaxID=2211119 RepID=A0A328C5D6_9DELT|nr:glycosyltransferase [Lujinxingia litoralis]RAL21122.1 glycosyl transferase [Lujinxingia litoralis]